MHTNYIPISHKTYVLVKQLYMIDPFEPKMSAWHQEDEKGDC